MRGRFREYIAMCSYESAPRHVLAVLCCFLVAPFGISSASGSDTLMCHDIDLKNSEDIVEEYFQKIAFSPEIYGNVYDRVTKWHDPWKVSIAWSGAQSDPEILEYLSQFLKVVSLNANRRVTFERSVADSNIYYFFIDKYKYEYQLERMVRGDWIRNETARRMKEAIDNQEPACMLEYKVDESYQIIRGTIVIYSGLENDLIKSCIEEETIQVMGLPNDISESDISIFSDNNVCKRATKLDLFLLRVLYNPEIIAGQAKEQAMRVLPSIIKSEYERLSENNKSNKFGD